MRNETRLLTTGFLSLSLALSGCLKSGEEATGNRLEPATSLDADHGGARIMLPEIDPVALGKAGADTVSDTVAIFTLSITGDNMSELAYKFPVLKQVTPLIEIKGIPAGKLRSFHGKLFNAKGTMTHEGVTRTDIQGGAYTDVRLFLAKAGGFAEVCVVIEGQSPPACAKNDSVPPPRDSVPAPKPGPGTVGSIPRPGSGAKETVLCFEVRFDYANSACETQGYAKMTFLDGKIPYGDLGVADNPFRDYMGASGAYDSAAIRFAGVTEPGYPDTRDTLSMHGYIGAGGTMAKGDYERLPSGKKGVWTMSVVECGSWIPKYPDPSCAAK